MKTINDSLLTALSPLDGRYVSKLKSLQPLYSEYGLIYHRLLVEIRWLEALAAQPQIKEVRPLKISSKKVLENLLKHFNVKAAQAIKMEEKITNHDVKAIEYYLQKQLKKSLALKPYIPFLHFACTSEDINNLAYGLMLKEARSKVMLPEMKSLQKTLKILSKKWAKIPMLARTHGQPASPTTIGKELANFTYRLERQSITFEKLPILGKINGAVGNFNAHVVAYPKINWPQFSKKFVASLGLTFNPYTTQIEPHDGLAEILHCLIRFNTIAIDLCRDMWSYISLNYFSQKKVSKEIGSSTMPHKINPIDFENAEGNLGLANALANHLASKLPISRFQRDLSDSTVMRNIGSILGYSLLAYQSLLKGLSKLSINEKILKEELNEHWEILAEAIQTVMRKHGIIDAYEQLKKFTRGKKLNQKTLHQFINQLKLPLKTKNELKQLTPLNYIGYANKK